MFNPGPPHSLEDSISSLDDFWSHYNELRGWLRASSEVLEDEVDPALTLQEQRNKAEDHLSELESRVPDVQQLKYVIVNY